MDTFRGRDKKFRGENSTSCNKPKGVISGRPCDGSKERTETPQTLAKRPRMKETRGKGHRGGRRGLDTVSCGFISKNSRGVR